MLQVFMKKPAQNRAGFYFELESSIIFSRALRHVKYFSQGHELHYF